MNIKENYQQYVSRYASEVAALKRKNTGFITGELLAFGGILAFLICYFALDGDTQNYLMGAALCLIAYLGIRRLDDKNKEKIEHLSALLKVYQDEIKAWEGDFSPFETGDSLSESAASLFLRPRCLRQEFAVQPHLPNHHIGRFGGTRQESYPGNASEHGGYQKKKGFAEGIGWRRRKLANGISGTWRKEQKPNCGWQNGEWQDEED